MQQNQRTLVLLGSTGNPDINSLPEIRAYLRRFLSDRNVIHMNPVIWQLILRLFILPKRAPRVMKDYHGTAINGKGALTHYMECLEKNAKGSSDSMEFKCVACYTHPFLDEVLKGTDLSSFTDVVVLPLFPQYTPVTHDTCFEQARDYLGRQGFRGNIREVRGYWQNPLYAETVCRGIVAQMGESTDVILTFHSLPVDYIQKGDAYQGECEGSFKVLRERLSAAAGLPPERIHMAYHCPFSKSAWLGPMLEETATGLVKKGVRQLCVAAPGFAIDCLETLDDIDIGCTELFMREGGERMYTVKCLNDSADQVRLLGDVAARALMKG